MGIVLVVLQVVLLAEVVPVAVFLVVVEIVFLAAVVPVEINCLGINN